MSARAWTWDLRDGAFHVLAPGGRRPDVGASQNQLEHTLAEVGALGRVAVEEAGDVGCVEQVSHDDSNVVHALGTGGKGEVEHHGIESEPAII